jgi:hypothetical protein
MRHLERPRFHQRGGGISRVSLGHSAQDPSLRLKNGYARNDAIEKVMVVKFLTEP